MGLSIVGCSNLKMPTPCPAWLLYSASPTFSQRYSIAKRTSSKVLILSGKYGLIPPEIILKPYDQKIKVTEDYIELVRSQVRKMGLESV